MPDARRRRDRLRIIILLLAASVIYLIGNASVPLWDRDEPRYAQTSRQMLRSGDWIVPRLLDEVRTAKPIFIYWCQAGAMTLLGDTAFAARLPSAIAMLLTLIVVVVVIDRTIGSRRALWTAFILATSGLSIAAAKMCITDAVQLLWVTIAQMCLVGIYVRARFPLPLVMWIAIALAGLTKGPVVIGAQLTTMLALAALDVGRNWRSIGAWRNAIRWWQHTRPLLGILIVVLICGPWLYFIHQREPTFLPTIIGHDVLARVRTGLEGHRGPPGYYLLTIWVTYFPWSLFLPATLVWAWRRRANPILRFALAAVIGPWVMFEIVQTKLVHYLLPVFPALAFLTADLLIRESRRRQGELRSRGFVGVVSGWAILVGLLGLLPWLALRQFDRDRIVIVATAGISVVCVAYGAIVWMQFQSRHPLRAAAFMGCGMLLFVAALYGLYLPHASFLHLSPRVARVLLDNGATDRGDAIMIDYKEDSLAFYQGGTIRRESDDLFLLKTPPWEWPRWVVITDRVWSAHPSWVREQFDEVARVRGLWYVKGMRVVEVVVLRRKTTLT
jgi:4-amino-4-deoxy-L-arabinose transferase-like glycosyltransferase